MTHPDRTHEKPPLVGTVTLRIVCKLHLSETAVIFKDVETSDFTLRNRMPQISTMDSRKVKVHIFSFSSFLGVSSGKSSAQYGSIRDVLTVKFRNSSTNAHF